MSVENLATQISNVVIDAAEMDEIANQIAALHTQIAILSARVPDVPQVVTYEATKVEISDVKEISLEMFKALPTFDGDRDLYSSWRETAVNVMRVFTGFTKTPKYFEALNVVRAKIIGTASKTLTNYNTVLNIDAIISRLDFAYSDKRPIYIVEQEMTGLQQRNLSVDGFYDLVNIKLNALMNKINMSFSDKSAAQAMIHEASAKALRTFVTGLNGGLGNTLYSSNPQSLPDAYARLQTIMYDQQLMRSTHQQPQMNKNHGTEPHRNHPNFTYKQNGPAQNTQNNRSSFNNNHNSNRSFANNRNHFRPQQNNWQNKPKPEPMEIDKSSVNVNVGNSAGGQRGGNFSRSNIQHRINQMENEAAAATDEEYEADILEEDEEAAESSSVFSGN